MRFWTQPFEDLFDHLQVRSTKTHDARSCSRASWEVALVGDSGGKGQRRLSRASPRSTQAAVTAARCRSPLPSPPPDRLSPAVLLPQFLGALLVAFAGWGADGDAVDDAAHALEQVLACGVEVRPVVHRCGERVP